MSKTKAFEQRYFHYFLSEECAREWCNNDDGLHTEWHGNCVFRCRINYKNRAIQGCVKIFDRNGQISDESNYKDGKRHGLRKKYSYFENNVKTEEWTYKNGEISLCRIWDFRGKLVKEWTVRRVHLVNGKTQTFFRIHLDLPELV